MAKKKYVLVYFESDNSFSVLDESIVVYENDKKTHGTVKYVIKRKIVEFRGLIVTRGTQKFCDEKCDEMLKDLKYALMYFGNNEAPYHSINKLNLVKENSKNCTAFVNFTFGKKNKLIKGLIIHESSQDECEAMSNDSNNFSKKFKNKTAIEQAKQKINLHGIFRSSFIDNNQVDLDNIFNCKGLNKLYEKDQQEI